MIAGNWKMHHDHFAAIQFIQKLSYLLTDEDYARADVVVCPPFTDLRSVQTTIQSDKLKLILGAQNCHWEDKGAWTGEISPVFLSKLSVEYVIVGHSERRQLLGETDEVVNEKLTAVLRHGMTPIVCVGETLDEREAGATESRIDSQLRGAFAGVKPDVVGACVVAYEPIWAIGTGHNATPEQANETVGFARKVLGDIAKSAGTDVRIQYGGSVKPGNIGSLMDQPEIDGALVGGASLESEDFARIVRWQGAS